jgi:hypothetical protein
LDKPVIDGPVVGTIGRAELWQPANAVANSKAVNSLPKSCFMLMLSRRIIKPREAPGLYFANWNKGQLLGRGGGLLETVGSAEFLAESFQSAGGVHEFLFAGEKRVAGTANIDVDPAQRAAGGEGAAAGAMHGTILISRVNLRFHGPKLLLSVVRRAKWPVRQPNIIVTPPPNARFAESPVLYPTPGAAPNGRKKNKIVRNGRKDFLIRLAWGQINAYNPQNFT